MDHHLFQAVRARALAKDIVLYSWTTHLTLTVPLLIQENQKWFPANVIMLGPCDGSYVDLIFA